LEDRQAGRLTPWSTSLQGAPWWALILAVLGLFILYEILNNEGYRQAFLFLRSGIRLTLIVTVSAYAIAATLGLITGLGRVSNRLVTYTVATLYVEVIRGVPMLVQLIYVAFVVVPLGIAGANALGAWLLHAPALATVFQAQARWLTELSIRDVDMTTRGIIGLAIGYGAYEAEVYRAGIQSIEKGQMEAARSLGMNYIQAMRYVILPQAIKRVLPPLGNDFIAMLKDSSLLSALAVRELTQLGKLNRASTFRTFETWNTVTFLYLTMTILLSMGVKLLERRMAID
jgi:polar amino acid transport system permease protein